MKSFVHWIFRELRFLHKYSWGGIWNFRKGFLPSTKSVCRINKQNYKEFLSDKEYFIGHPWNGAYSGIIDNKLYLPLLMKDYPQNVPKYYYFKDKSGFLPLIDFNGHRESIDDFLKLLACKKKLCLKHTHSSVGVGFMLVEERGDKYFINDKEVNIHEAKSLIDSYS